MSFGRPSGVQIKIGAPEPPERGSFPLDHDGECKPVMQEYLQCLKKVRGTNDPECRLLAKAYLQCRMDRNLMARDSMENLGFHDEKSKLKSSMDIRLEELRRENEMLKKKREEEERKEAGKG